NDWYKFRAIELKKNFPIEDILPKREMVCVTRILKNQSLITNEPFYDAIIIGGGIAGSSFAIRISQLFDSSELTFKKILIIEKKSITHNSFKVGESLPAEAKPVLQLLGVLEKINDDTIQASLLLRQQLCMGSNNLNGTNSIFNPYGNGFHLDRLLFEETLLKTIESRYGHIVKVIHGFNVANLRFNFNGDFAEDKKFWEITISKFDASGRRCCIRKYIPSLKRESFDKLLAFVCLFKSAYLNGLKDNDHNTLIESCCYGWFQTSQLPNNQRVIIFFTDDDLVKQLPQRIKVVDEFVDFLRENSHNINKILKEFDYTPIENRVMCMAANSEVLSEFASTKNQWISIGDSAISFDPLSSQGILTALYNSKFGSDVTFFQFFYDKSLKESGNKSNETDNNIQPFDIYTQKLTQMFNNYKEEKIIFIIRSKDGPI
ncbi:21567_t:CDS:2, partial [Racocetra persica]